MKKIKKLVAIVLVLALIVCAVPMTALADTTFSDSKLNGRSDFRWGVTMHNPSMNNYAYPAVDLIDHIHLAAEMGTKLIRIDYNKDKSYVEDAITLCNAYGIEVMLTVGITGMTITEARTSEQLAQITESFKEIGDRFVDAKGLGIEYIQIGNEIDCQLLSAKYGSEAGAHSGAVKDNYDEAHINNVVAQFNAAIAGLKASSTAAQTVINFTWTHYGFIEWMEDKGLDYDVVGHGVYGTPENLASISYTTMVSDIAEVTTKPIIVVEANIRQTEETILTEETDLLASSYDSLVNIMSQAYAINQVKGFVFYELVDQLDKETTIFNREAHFGLIKYNSEKVLIVKPIYERIKHIIGGTTLEKLTGPNTNYQYNIYSEHKEIDLSATKNYTKDWRLFDYMTYYNNTRFNEPIDITKAEYIELDVYLSEAVGNLAVYFGTNAANDQNVEVGFYDWPNRATYSNGKNPKSAGWHHLVYKVSSFNICEKNWNPTSVTGLILAANDYDADGNAIQTSTIDIRIKNFALTREVPFAENTYVNNIYEYEEGKLSYKDGLLTQGTSKASGTWGGTWLFDNNPNIYMDATDAEFIEFDMWVSADTTEFNIWMSNYISQVNPGRNSYKVPALKGGEWNHVWIEIAKTVQKVGTFDATKFNSIFFEGSPNANQVQFKVANIGLSKFAPEASYENYLVNNYSEIDLDYTYQVGKDGNTYGNLYWSTAFSSNLYMNNTQFTNTVNFNNADYIEFDMYFSVKPDTDFIMYASNRGWAVNPPRAKADIRAAGLKQGWNHIVIAISDFYDIDEGTYPAGGVNYTFDWSCIKGLSLDGRPIKDNTNGIRLAVTNFALTAKDYAKQEIAYIGNALSTYNGYDKVTIEAGVNLDSLLPIDLNVATDLSKIEYIEMNLFVESKSDITIHISSAPSVDEISSEFSAAKLLDDINFGWNQLHIPVAEILDTENDNGWSFGDFFDSTAVCYIYFEGTLSDDLETDFTVEDLAFTANLGYEIAEGDFNTDGNTDIIDLVNLKKYTAVSKKVFFANKAEISGKSKNGVIDAGDLAELRKFLLNR